MGNQLGLRDKNKFALLWVVDFPMFEWSDEENRLMAMHHPFTHPKEEDIPLLDTNPEAVRADAYDMVALSVYMMPSYKPKCSKFWDLHPNGPKSSSDSL